MKLLIGLLVIGTLGLGNALDRKRREARRLPRPDLNRWEGEGGAVPVSSSHSAAQTPHAADPVI